MNVLYNFKLPEAVDGMSHVGVTEEIRDSFRIKVTGIYGRLLAGGFEGAVKMQAFRDDIRGDRLIDLDAQSLVDGRPVTKTRSDMDQGDVAKWLAEDPEVISDRIIDRGPEETRFAPS